MRSSSTTARARSAACATATSPTFPPGVPVIYDRPWGETRDIEALYAHWRLASRLVADHPLLLAGRLDPDNVAQAVREVRPYGVDCASGVESAAGIKDHERVRRLVAAAKEAG